MPVKSAKRQATQGLFLTIFYVTLYPTQSITKTRMKLSAKIILQGDKHRTVPLREGWL